jgi:pyruvate dehydrogenase E1 component alpha subunit
MVLIRRFEEAAASLIAANRIPGFIHLSIGQEAVAVGVTSALRETDRLTSTHRGHGHCIAKGGKVDRMMAELFGKPEGYCGGRSGSMHIADPSVGILGANAIVAGGLAIAVGSAYTARVTGGSEVTVAFLGEGAVAEGLFHECLNLAALWQLPIVYVCENNQYAELSHVSVHLNAARVADFAGPHRIPSATVDGNDLIAVRSAATTAVGRARSGGGPSLLEFETYRLHGHFEGDPQRYRPAAELAAWKERDPIPRFRGELIERWAVPPEVLDELEDYARREVEDAVAWAEALPGHVIPVGG